MTREELLKSPIYWTNELQNELYRQIYTFMNEHQMNKSQLADHLGCSKGYVTQLLNGEFDHKISKFFELALAINKIPEVRFTDVDEYIQTEKNSYEQVITLFPDRVTSVYNSNDNRFIEVA